MENTFFKDNFNLIAKYTILIVVVIVVFLIVKAFISKIIGPKPKDKQDYNVTIKTPDGTVIDTWNPQPLADAINDIRNTTFDGGTSAADCVIRGKQINTWIGQVATLAPAQLQALNDYWNDHYKIVKGWIWNSEQTLYEAIDNENTGFLACLDASIKTEALNTLSPYK